VREGRWEAARETLSRAAKRRIVAPEPARHRLGVIRHELSLAAAARGDRRQAIALAAQAQSLAQDLAVPALHHARLLLEDQRIGPAAKAVERAWRTAPHPGLAQLYGAIRDGEPPLARLKMFERLAGQNPAARESHLAVAEAALEAKLWGEARTHLERALMADPPPLASPKPANATAFAPPLAEERPLAPASLPVGEGGPPARPTARQCLMMARLEEAEHGDFARTREWLDRAVEATPDPCYVCARCGGESLEWYSLCPHCGAFDALVWQTPARAVPGGAGPEMIGGGPAAELAAVPSPEPSPVDPATG
jgi:HemY protein